MLELHRALAIHPQFAERRIAQGMPADIIAVRGDPLEDVTRLEHVDFVMKRGAVVKQVR